MAPLDMGMPRFRTSRPTRSTLHPSCGICPQQSIARTNIARIEIAQPVEIRIIGREIGLGCFEQLLETLDDEIALLIIINAIARPHDAQQIEGDALGAGVFEAIDRFAFRGDDARAVDAQPVRCRDESELYRVPIKPREMLEIVE